MFNDQKFQDDDGWSVMEGFANEVGFLSHQIEQYNEFASSTYLKIIEKDPEVVVNDHAVLITNPILETPTHREMNDSVNELYPHESIRRDIPYNAKLYADVSIRIPTKDETGAKRYAIREHKSVLIGSIPAMVDSVLCNRTKIKAKTQEMAKRGEDICCNGGFFITKGGSLKVISGQQQTASNQIYIFAKRIKAPKFDTFAEVRSTNTGFKSTTTRVGIKNGIVSVHLPYVEGVSIPLGVVYHALGIASYAEILKYVYPNGNSTTISRILTSTFEASYSSNMITQDDALYYIGVRGQKKTKDDKKKTDAKKDRASIISYATHLLATELLPHVGNGVSSFVLKAFYLGCMASELFDALIKKRQLEDRDHYKIKINATIGILFGQLFHTAYKKFRKEITKTMEKCIKQNEFINIQAIIKPTIIKNVMNNALTNSSWGGTNKTPGISQPYDRFNYGASLANARKFMTTITTEGGKIEAPRQYHPSHYGAVDPETPEGKKCGLINNQALSGVIAVGCNKEEIIELMKHEFDIHPVETIYVHRKYWKLGWCKIFVNGSPVGFTDVPDLVTSRMKDLRRRGKLIFELSITLSPDKTALHIRSDPGRFLRPFLIVENGQVRLTKTILNDMKAQEKPIWTMLLHEGYVEFLSKAEEEFIRAVMYPSDLDEMDLEKALAVDYCEISPCLMFGIGMSQIPFSHCNQAPRNVYQASMGKQSIGVPGMNCFLQSKTKTYILSYPQLPLIRTKATDLLKICDLPSGQNVIVAVMPWYGFGQEDSLILNEDSYNRGLFDTTVLLPFSTKVKIDKGEEVEVPVSTECDNLRGNASKLDPETGVVKIGVWVDKGDILIGVTTKKESGKKHSNSVIYDQTRGGTVFNIEKGVDGEGYEYIRVVISQLRKPSIGDKFSSFHSQKGTESVAYRAFDLPFDQEGIPPDVIINALAFPSRMTVGMNVEMATGRMVCSGHFKNHIAYKKALCLDTLGEEEDNECEPITYSSKGSCVDGTPFRKDFSVEEDIVKELALLGVNGFCEDIMTNGQTGEEIRCPIFNGVCTYQRLKHMTEDKIHARSKGGKVRLTGQPTEGRKFGGGFRVGVMERDVIVSQGSSYFLKDRLMDQSDKTEGWFCAICGFPAIATRGNPKQGIPPIRECNVCNSGNVVLVEFTYAAKLVMQELLGMGIAMRLIATKFEVGDSVTFEGGNEKVYGVVKGF